MDENYVIKIIILTMNGKLLFQSIEISERKDLINIYIPSPSHFSNSNYHLPNSYESIVPRYESFYIHTS